MADPKAENLVFVHPDIPSWRQDLSNRVVNLLLALGGNFRRHWLGLTNAVNILFLLGSFLAPLLALANLTALSTPLYRLYSLFCLQRPDHSFFLANFQMGMEVRMVAITTGNLAAGLWFFRFRKARPISWQSYFFLSLPMLLDVLSQTVGLRDSNWLWRSLTGFLFGLVTVWYFYPRFERLAGLTRQDALAERIVEGPRSITGVNGL
ncbi:MAG TPA: DUF2085 domain-containing protein [Chloroflexia bacterium]|nr:DUF2085 domain-containing protein [Chloroflexia bacterium]